MIDATKVAEVAGVSIASAYKLIADLEPEILKEVTGAKRGKVYIFSEYLNLFH
jgi:hypothetical protein